MLNLERDTQKKILFGLGIAAVSVGGYVIVSRLLRKRKSKLAKLEPKQELNSVVKKLNSTLHNSLEFSELAKKVGSTLKDVMSNKSIGHIFTEIKDAVKGLTQEKSQKNSEKDENSHDKNKVQNESEAHEKDGFETVYQSVEINLPVKEVYSFWRDLENLPLFMSHLEEVKVIDDQHSCWKVATPFGTNVEWQAEITDEEENKFFSWRSEKGDIVNYGTVTFTAKNEAKGIKSKETQKSQNSTRVKIELKYEPILGKVGEKISLLFGENPEQQIKEDLQNLKYYLEKKGTHKNTDLENKESA